MGIKSMKLGVTGQARALYGGNLFYSKPRYQCTQVAVSAFQYQEFELSLIKIGDNSSSLKTSLFSSDPFRVCGCAPNPFLHTSASKRHFYTAI